MTCANSVLPMFMHHPRLFKPESIANVQIEIQIVDTHGTLETRIVIGLQAFGHHLNRTLLESGLLRTYIGSVERGEKNLTLRNAIRIAGALGCKASELMAAAGL